MREVTFNDIKLTIEDMRNRGSPDFTLMGQILCVDKDKLEKKFIQVLSAARFKSLEYITHVKGFSPRLYDCDVSDMKYLDFPMPHQALIQSAEWIFSGIEPFWASVHWHALKRSQLCIALRKVRKAMCWENLEDKLNVKRDELEERLSVLFGPKTDMLVYLDFKISANPDRFCAEIMTRASAGDNSFKKWTREEYQHVIDEIGSRLVDPSVFRDWRKSFEKIGESIGRSGLACAMALKRLLKTADGEVNWTEDRPSDFDAYCWDLIKLAKDRTRSREQKVLERAVSFLTGEINADGKKEVVQLFIEAPDGVVCDWYKLNHHMRGFTFWPRVLCGLLGVHTSSEMMHEINLKVQSGRRRMLNNYLADAVGIKGKDIKKVHERLIKMVSDNMDDLEEFGLTDLSSKITRVYLERKNK